jgi:hypothetical protein
VRYLKHKIIQRHGPLEYKSGMLGVQSEFDWSYITFWASHCHTTKTHKTTLSNYSCYEVMRCQYVRVQPQKVFDLDMENNIYIQLKSNYKAHAWHAYSPPTLIGAGHQ